MRLKLKKFRNPRFNVLIVALGAGKTLTWRAPGEIQEIDDEAGYKIMSDYNDCLEIDGAQLDQSLGEKFFEAPANKMASSSRRK